MSRSAHALKLLGCCLALASAERFGVYYPPHLSHSSRLCSLGSREPLARANALPLATGAGAGLRPRPQPPWPELVSGLRLHPPPPSSTPVRSARLHDCSSRSRARSRLQAVRLRTHDRWVARMRVPCARRRRWAAAGLYLCAHRTRALGTRWHDRLGRTGARSRLQAVRLRREAVTLSIRVFSSMGLGWALMREAVTLSIGVFSCNADRA